MGKKISDVNKTDRYIGSPPALGMIPTWVWAGCILFFESVTKWNLFANLMVGNVRRYEITVADKKIIKFMLWNKKNNFNEYQGKANDQRCIEIIKNIFYKSIVRIKPIKDIPI